MENRASGHGREVVRGFLRMLLAIPLLLLLPGLLEAGLSTPAADLDSARNERAERSYQYIKAHLEAPHEGYGDPPGFSLAGWKIAALSYMASGLMSMSVDATEIGDHARLAELGGLLEEVARRATSEAVSPYEVPIEDIDNFDDWGFYLGHLSLTLGCVRHISGTTQYDALHGRIVRYQMTRSADDGDHHSRSYPNSYKWPADQALTLAGASLYDRIHGSELSTVPIEGWLTEMTDISEGGLHPLALSVPTAMPIDGEGTLLEPLPHASTPRGSALSPTVFYMAQFAPEDAATLYQTYRSKYLDSVLGFGGFREWPGEGGSDIEAGPVIAGLGSIATGLGLAPAHLYSDQTAYTTIMRSALVAGVPSDLGAGRGHLLAPLLGEAILFHGLTARAWFSEPVPLLPKDRPALPVGVGLLFVLDLGLLAALLWRPTKHLLARRRPAPAALEMSETVTTPEPQTHRTAG